MGVLKSLKIYHPGHKVQTFLGVLGWILIAFTAKQKQKQN